MNNGWIYLHRKILDWEWYSDQKTFRLFLHLLLTANHQEKKWLGITIFPGQKLTSHPHLAQETGLGVQSVRTSLLKLKSTGELTVKTTNKYSIITLLNWDSYQKLTGKSTGNQQATNRLLTTNKESNKEITPTVAPRRDEKGSLKTTNDDEPRGNPTLIENVVTQTKGGEAEEIDRLLATVEKTRGKPYINKNIQRNHIRMMLTAKKTIEEIGKRWLKLARSEYYKEKGGVDFNTVLKSFDRDYDH